MDPSKILLFDLVPRSGLGEEIAGVLWSSTAPVLEVRHAKLDAPQLSGSSVSFASSLATFAPDVTFLLLASDLPKIIPPLFKAFRASGLSGSTIAIRRAENEQEMDELLRCGASDFLVPPIRPFELLPRLRRLLHSFKQARQLDPVRRETPELKALVGESPDFLTELAKIPLLALSDASVLICGETGTGKEICARAIHYLSARAGKPFVPLNCGAIPLELIENELFGHERGAFTGADAAHEGLVQAAEGGTMFLDEVDSLPLKAQVKLLRLLQDKEFLRLGSAKIRKADIRIIAASNINLEEKIKTGLFRRDLFYRINVVNLTMPALRTRAGDVIVLAHHFMGKLSGHFGKPVKHFSPAALQKLSLYDWPGNVRELENVISRAVVLSENEDIEAGDITLSQATPDAKDQPFKARKAAAIREFEIKYLKELLGAYEGNISQAAQAAGMDRSAFKQLLRKNQIETRRTTAPQ